MYTREEGLASPYLMEMHLSGAKCICSSQRVKASKKPTHWVNEQEGRCKDKGYCTCYVVHTGLKLVIFLTQPPNAGITVRHHPQFMLEGGLFWGELRSWASRLCLTFGFLSFLGGNGHDWGYAEDVLPLGSLCSAMCVTQDPGSFSYTLVINTFFTVSVVVVV